MSAQKEKVLLQDDVTELEDKLVEKSVEIRQLRDQLSMEAQARNELEISFIEKLEKLSELMSGGTDGSTHDM